MKERYDAAITSRLARTDNNLKMIWVRNGVHDGRSRPKRSILIKMTSVTSFKQIR